MGGVCLLIAKHVKIIIIVCRLSFQIFGKKNKQNKKMITSSCFTSTDYNIDYKIIIVQRF